MPKYISAPPYGHSLSRNEDALDRVFSKIQRVRQPGDPPRETLDSFDEFECDLCKGILVRRELTQCHYCGRWVCREQCWDRETLACTSCASVIKLAKELGPTEREAPEGQASGQERSHEGGQSRPPLLGRLKSRRKG